MFKRIISVLALVFVLFSALSFASPVLADSDGSKVAGVIAAVDTAANTITITPANGGASVTLNVDASTKIKKNGQPATLADLLVGEKAGAKYNPATMLASGIDAKSESAAGQANARGVIASVDVAANTITITPANGGANVTFSVDASTKIKNNGKVATLADLAVGEKANVRFNPSTLLASGIDAKSEPASGQANVKGVIASVDAAASTITIAPANGGADVTFSVDASTKIKNNGKAATLADLSVGEKANVRFNPATMLAGGIEAKSESVANQAGVRGVIASVDAAAHTVTITPANGGANMTLSVDASTIIKKDRQTVTLSDLVIGDQAEIKYDSTTMLAFSIEVKL